MGTSDRENFAAWAAAELPGLRRFAYAVGGDWHRADDLVQAALERMYVVWPKLGGVADLGAYARTVLVRQAATETRRAWWRRERVTDVIPETPSPADGDGDSAARLDLARVLGGLSVKQRAIVVLRFVEDRPVREVAELLGVAEGTVKRQCHEALAHLRRRLLADAELDLEEA
ncbi:RNA polymerase sigma factor [Jiangella rhizosphaerae]|uniref:Sigma-70 family RNA polymerase sigma factor n=1 Tax=Jiangella rhizosphaerae TaxID=2293569 RepID=A0A418KUM1_9ACTN|nr:sigma-70 family RNA polymerase sigma factor [Jiangella rhizosphaerae]RIQ31917.1 sigma-70 family RNA polymerase sigma factor [Jiangella rhizosphaerae]